MLLALVWATFVFTSVALPELIRNVCVSPDTSSLPTTSAGFVQPVQPSTYVDAAVSAMGSVVQALMQSALPAMHVRSKIRTPASWPVGVMPPATRTC